MQQYGLSEAIHWLSAQWLGLSLAVIAGAVITTAGGGNGWIGDVIGSIGFEFKVIVVSIVSKLIISRRLVSQVNAPLFPCLETY